MVREIVDNYMNFGHVAENNSLNLSAFVRHIQWLMLSQAMNQLFIFLHRG